MNNKGERFFYIGANSTGKTRELKKVQSELINESIFFDENGLVNSVNFVPNVEIIDDSYLYIDESRRGTDESIKTDKINPEILPILNKIKSLNISLKMIKNSPGINKLLIITDELLSKNLNNIRAIILDEPESLLDDENLKILISLMELFRTHGIKLIYATHSSRFLELNRAELDEIIVLKKSNRDYQSYNTTVKKVNEIYYEISDEIINSSCIFRTSRNDNIMKAKLQLFENSLVVFLESILYSHEFYRCLFYSDVILAEGLTEKLLVSSMPSEKIKNKNFYFTNGKVYIPFFINLFSEFGLDIRVIFDSDQNIEGNTTSSSELTLYIKEKYVEQKNVELIMTLKRDLEADYGINEDAVKNFKGNSNISNRSLKDNYFKPYIALHKFLENPHLYTEFTKRLFLTNEQSEYELD